MPNLEALRDVFRRYPGVQAVYLFGSTADGSLHEDSDVDLAVIPRDPSCREQRLQMLADLVRVGLDNVDLVFLDTDDLVLAYEAVRPNHVVYQTEDFDRGATYSRVVRMYLDFRRYLDVQREAYKRRVLAREA